MTKLDSILKNGEIILLTKVCIVKAMIFPLIMYSCESWTIKKVERGRIDALKLGCWRRFRLTSKSELNWRRLLRVPWTSRRSKQSILKVSQP